MQLQKKNKQIDSGLIMPGDDPPPMSSSRVQEIEKFDATKEIPPALLASSYDEKAPPVLPPWEPRPGADHVRGPFATSSSSIGTILVVGSFDQTPVTTTAEDGEPALLNAELVQDKMSTQFQFPTMVIRTNTNICNETIVSCG